MRTTLKDVVSGRVLEKRFNIGEASKTCAWNVAPINTSIRRVKTTSS